MDATIIPFPTNQRETEVEQHEIEADPHAQAQIDYLALLTGYKNWTFTSGRGSPHFYSETLDAESLSKVSAAFRDAKIPFADKLNDPEKAGFSGWDIQDRISVAVNDIALPDDYQQVFNSADFATQELNGEWKLEGTDFVTVMPVDDVRRYTAILAPFNTRMGRIDRGGETRLCIPKDFLEELMGNKGMLATLRDGHETIHARVEEEKRTGIPFVTPINKEFGFPWKEHWEDLFADMKSMAQAEKYQSILQEAGVTANIEQGENGVRLVVETKAMRALFDNHNSLNRLRNGLAEVIFNKETGITWNRVPENGNYHCASLDHDHITLLQEILDQAHGLKAHIEQDGSLTVSPQEVRAFADWVKMHEAAVEIHTKESSLGGSLTIPLAAAAAAATR